MTTVIVEPDESFETALTRFEKPRENSGRLYELRTPRHHDEPGLERTPIPVGEPVPTVREALRSFVRLILDAEPPPATLEDGARAVAIAEACLASAATGRAVSL